MTQPETITEVLEPEHRWIDERFERFQALLASGQVNAEPFEEAAKALHRHMYVEEEILFPEVATRGLAAPVQVMYQDHGEIARLMNVVHGLIASGASTADLEAALAAVIRVLGEHGAKEELVLYPTADQVLVGPEFAQLVQRVREEAVPEGWLCRALSGGH
jgi:iron-sulfur cluster repair protein YtfE (RIC family)